MNLRKYENTIGTVFLCFYVNKINCYFYNNIIIKIIKWTTFGENKQANVTLADKLIVTDIDVIRSGTWFAVPKYKGTNASQITHVVYIVKPIWVQNKFNWIESINIIIEYS